jgi:uncharacterized protein YbjT (DUF2867 family)
MILVTGAAGLSGTHIVNELAAQGVPFRALVRNRPKALAIFPEKVDIVEGDMSRPETLGPALEGIDKALLISSGDARMLETQCSFIDACKRAGVEHVVKFSGNETGFDRSRFRFTDMHAQAERYLERSGLRWTHLQPCGFMQVYLREARAIRESGQLRLATGDITLAPIDVLDIARISVAVLQAPRQDGRRHLMTGPEALTMAEIARLMSAAAGRPVDYVAITPEQRRRELLAAGAPPYFADALFEQATERLRNPKAVVHLESHAEFNMIPTSFSQFLQRNAFVFQ